MADRKDQIVEAAIRTFVRFGPRKTSMVDIAAEAGVSRQTLYDLFDGKDELVERAILHVSKRNLADVQDALADCANLSERLDAYFRHTVVRSFELLESAGDAEELLSGHGEAGRQALGESHRRHEALVARIFEDREAGIVRNGLTVARAAHLTVTTVMGFKQGATSREDLDRLLESLKAALLLLAGDAE